MMIGILCTFFPVVSNDDRNSLHFSHLLTQAESVPLERAVWGGDIETVRKHLESGANVNYQNKVNIPFFNPNT